MMISEIQIRNRIFKRIKRIPNNKLKKLEDYVIQLEEEIGNPSKTLLLAGACKDLDETVFNELTINLLTNRQSNRQRINE